MKRKLVQQGQSTLMISLPSEWIKRNELKKGDEVDIQSLGASLSLTKEGQFTKKNVSINIRSLTESAVRTALVNAYRFGADKVEIQFKNLEQFQIIILTLKHYLLGMEVTTKGTHSCTLETISEPSVEQFDIIFQKIFYSISLLIELTEERFAGKQPIESYHDIVYKVHQYDNFCRRVIAKQNRPAAEASLFNAFATLLIHGQRELYHLNQYLNNHKQKIVRSILLSATKELVMLLQKGYVSKDLASLEQVHEREKELIYGDLYTHLTKKGNNTIILFHLGSAIKNFYLAASPAMGLIMNAEK